MCQPRKWWWGLLPLMALWMGALAFLTPDIESELTHRLKTTIAKEAPWAKTAVEGRDVVIEGIAPTEEAGRRAMMAALNADGVRVATNAATLAPETKPFTWGASRDAAKITLSGYVAPDGTREKVIGEVRKAISGATIVDEMKDARGAPDGALSMMAVALGQLAKLKTGSVALSDNALTIKGSAGDQATAAAINASAKQLPPPMKLVAADISAPVPPPAPAPVVPKAPPVPVERPYVWQGVKQGDAVTLSGSVPSEAARAQALAAAKTAAGTGRVIDQLKIATGLPSGVDFNAATGFATTQLGQLRNGTAKLTDANLVIEGEAIDVAAYRALMAATAGALPGGMKLDRASITAPPVANYAWSAKREGKSIALNGFYPDEFTRQTMLSAANSRFPGLTLDDRTSIASGAPVGFGPALAMGLDQLSRLETGEASIAGGNLTITGVAPSEQIAGEVKSAVAKLVGGMPAETRLTFVAPATPPPVPVPAPAPAAPAPPPPVAAAPVVPKPAPAVVAACTADLATSVKSGVIRFESSRAAVVATSQPVIDQIASVMKRCPAMRIEIAGHTDSTGTPGFNETLSRDRAEAIATLLVKGGIDNARMKAAGYGSSKPVADNVTPEGKAKNRRIEFNVVE
jgi:OmpA-OmpF porin, OOP family